MKVSDIANDNEDLVRNRSGYTIHLFNTAKDFPIDVNKTEMNPHRVYANPITKLLKLDIYDGRSVSQGYTIELNDMHGKPAGQSIFDKDGALLSSTTYHYKTKADKTLDNEVAVIDSENVITKEKLGVEIETWTEMLEENSNIITGGMATNVDVFPLPIGLPFGLPTVYPIIKSSETQFRSASITKCINRCGILDSVTVVENGSSITTHNELYDAENGNVILTKTVNEFDDPIYDFKYPAHWVYEDMGQAYNRIGASFTNVNIVEGIIPSTIDDHFQPGDEVIVQDNNNLTYTWNFRIVELNNQDALFFHDGLYKICLLYTSPSPRDATLSRMPSSA